MYAFILLYTIFLSHYPLPLPPLYITLLSITIFTSLLSYYPPPFPPLSLISFSITISSSLFLSCFAESKKPRSALTVFHQMRKRRIAPNGYTYMGVLKALSHMRDGLSAVQVIGEMREKGVVPDKKHYAMAMFACVTSNQCGLAESIFAM